MEPENWSLSPQKPIQDPTSSPKYISTLFSHPCLKTSQRNHSIYIHSIQLKITICLWILAVWNGILLANWKSLVRCRISNQQMVLESVSQDLKTVLFVSSAQSKLVWWHSSNTVDFQSGSAWFESWLPYQLSWQGFSVFLRFSRWMSA